MLVFLMLACAPDTLIGGIGACELPFSDVSSQIGPFLFCVEETQGVCDRVHSSHTMAELEWLDTSCEEAGYPICCDSGVLDAWFASSEEADEARFAIAEEDCLPCE